MLGPLIAAGAALAGNLLNQQNQQSINAENMWAQNIANQQAMGLSAENRDIAMNFARENRDIARAEAKDLNAAAMAHSNQNIQIALADKERDRQLQQDFAQMGIKWRVEDAERAGVHPLFALGGGGAAYAPSAISLGSPSMSAAPMGASVSGGTPSIGASRSVAGSAFGNMGQDVSRAVLAAQNIATKNEAFETAYQDAQLRNMSLRNELLASQIGRLTQGGGAQKSTTKENEWPGTFEIKEAQSTALPEGYIMKGRSDAQVAEDRYDEIGANVWGMKNAVEDLAMNPGAAYRWWQWVNSQMIADQAWNYERSRGAYRDYYDIDWKAQRRKPFLGKGANPGPY